eukprot:1389302-Lingulodinium_polyedra.AAC.1
MDRRTGGQADSRTARREVDGRMSVSGNGLGPARKMVAECAGGAARGERRISLATGLAQPRRGTTGLA